jgi:hypothetical protein
VLLPVLSRPAQARTTGRPPIVRHWSMIAAGPGDDATPCTERRPLSSSSLSPRPVGPVVAPARQRRAGRMGSR